MKEDVKLYFIKEGNTWYYLIKNLLDDIIYQMSPVILFEENDNKEYFDGWENQIRMFPEYNVVEVHRFI